MDKSIDLEAVETKLAAARTKLILDKPFLGALVLRLPMKAADSDWCATTATDARRFYYNAEYIDSLSLSQTQFMLAHEALHCALSHFSRRQHRIKMRWDLACDFAINPLLIDDGLTPPPNAQIMPQYLGMTAEEIYPLIADNENMETLDDHLYDKENQNQGGQGKPPPKKDNDDQGKQGKSPIQDKDSDQQGEQGNQQGSETDPERQQGQSPTPKESEGEMPDDSQPPQPLTESEKQTLNTQWQQRLAGAAQQAMQAGKLGGTLSRLIDHLLQPQLPWRTLLARYISYTAKDDFSYMRPSRRESDAIMPSLRSSQVNLVVAIDTSGSIKPIEIAQFLSEISALKSQVQARTTVLSCDAEISDHCPWVFEPWEPVEIPDKIVGGGGTDFRPVFQWVEKENIKPDLLIYFTDAEGDFPPHSPAYSVLWLVKGKQPVPWGQRIQLN